MESHKLYRGDTLIRIEDILSGDFSAYPEEAREYMENFAEKFREKIKNELIEYMADKMLDNFDKGREYFVNVLGDLLNNGFKGYDKMSTAVLLDIYLENKGEEELFKLLENIDL